MMSFTISLFNFIRVQSHLWEEPEPRSPCRWWCNQSHKGGEPQDPPGTCCCCFCGCCFPHFHQKTEEYYHLVSAVVMRWRFHTPLCYYEDVKHHKRHHNKYMLRTCDLYEWWQVNIQFKINILLNSANWFKLLCCQTLV